MSNPSEDWVRIMTLNDEIAANLKKGLLEDAGIECQIFSSPCPGFSMLNQFDLAVPKDRAFAAKAILSELE